MTPLYYLKSTLRIRGNMAAGVVILYFIIKMAHIVYIAPACTQNFLLPIFPREPSQ